MNRRGFILAGAAAGGALLSGVNMGMAQSNDPFLNQILFDRDAPAIGNAKGDLTIVEYYDYQCPYCRANHPMLLDIVKKDGNLRLVMKDWPVLGVVSQRAARLGLGSVALGKYGQVNSQLMATRGRLTDENVDEALLRAGVDPTEAWRSYEADKAKWDGLLDRSFDQADRMGFFGTPSFVIGQIVAPGAQDELSLREMIAEARELGLQVKSG